MAFGLGPSYQPYPLVKNLTEYDSDRSQNSVLDRQFSENISWGQVGIDQFGKFLQEQGETLQSLLKKDGDTIVNDAEKIYTLIGLAISNKSEAGDRELAKETLNGIIRAAKEENPNHTNLNLDHSIELLSSGVQSNSDVHQLSVALDFIEQLVLPALTIDDATREVSNRLKRNGPVGQAFMNYGSALIDFASGSNTANFNKVMDLIDSDSNLRAKAGRVWVKMWDKAATENPTEIDPVTNTYASSFNAQIPELLSNRSSDNRYETAVNNIRATVKEHNKEQTRMKVKLEILEGMKAKHQEQKHSYNSDQIVTDLDLKISNLEKALTKDKENFERACDYMGWNFGKLQEMSSGTITAPSLERIFAEALVSENSNEESLMKDLFSEEELDKLVLDITGVVSSPAVGGNPAVNATGLELEISEQIRFLNDEAANISPAITNLENPAPPSPSPFGLALHNNPDPADRQAKAQSLLEAIKLVDSASSKNVNLYKQGDNLSQDQQRLAEDKSSIQQNSQLQKMLEERTDPTSPTSPNYNNYDDSEFKELLYEFLIREKEKGLDSILYNEDLDPASATVDPTTGAVTPGYALKNVELGVLQQLRDMNLTLKQIDKSIASLTELQGSENLKNTVKENLLTSSRNTAEIFLKTTISETNIDIVADKLIKAGTEAKSRIELRNPKYKIPDQDGGVIASGDTKGQPLVAMINDLLAALSEILIGSNTTTAVGSSA